tara:strand:+ start:4391 stop:4633 length:243 start_codon:yes stop_codon:yes gene_type:complete
MEASVGFVQGSVSANLKQIQITRFIKAEALIFQSPSIAEGPEFISSKKGEKNENHFNFTKFDFTKPKFVCYFHEPSRKKL